MVWEQLKRFENLLGGCEGKVKFAGLNAITHIFKAEELRLSDPHMACFRAICAEEEAATSLICSLQAHGYPQSEKISHWAHPNKAGVIVFIAGVIDWFNEHMEMDGMPFQPPRLCHVDEGGRPAIEVVFPLRDGKGVLHPRPPLHLLVQGDQSMDEMIGAAVLAKLRKKYAQEIRGAITVKANLRNSFLYASEEGLPKEFANCEGFILNQAAIVSALLLAVGLIDPWGPPKYQHAGLVVSAVSEFVRVMSSIKQPKV